MPNVIIYKAILNWKNYVDNQKYEIDAHNSKIKQPIFSGKLNNLFSIDKSKKIFCFNQTL